MIKIKAGENYILEIHTWFKDAKTDLASEVKLGHFKVNKKLEVAIKNCSNLLPELKEGKNDVSLFRECILSIKDFHLFFTSELVKQDYIGLFHKQTINLSAIGSKSAELILLDEEPELPIGFTHFTSAKLHIGRDYLFISGFARILEGEEPIYFQTPIYKTNDKF